MMADLVARRAEDERRTRESRVRVAVDVDGSGAYRVNTPIGMLSHMLESLARHARFDLEVEAEGDVYVDEHHTVEDVALMLGRMLNRARGDRKGIRRMGHAIVPLDEALAMVAVDLGGRPYTAFEAEFSDVRIGGLPVDLVRHFFESLATEAKMNLHVRLLAGRNDHHRLEAIFKATARALADAVARDPKAAGLIPSTKGIIEI
jgi:imidazoleglycerol-phosphate dehydratase